ncbi:type II restriction endonuclease [Marinitoga arctica]
MDRFDEFISTLSETNATLDYFTDFDKVINNVSKIEIKLNQLNYLLGKKDIKKAVYELHQENPKAFDVLDILIAVRKKHKKKVLDEFGNYAYIEQYFKEPENIYYFIKETGLEKIFLDKNITNLVDYVFGIEVGLDTNARKNRSGKNMAKIIEKIFNKNKISFKKEVNVKSFPEITSLGYDEKRFDYVINTSKKQYLIEVNFFNGGGSKPNEVARAYSELANKLKKYDEFEFVWITDGKGWMSAKNKIQEAFSIIDKIYNLHTLKKFIKIVKTEM